MTEKVGLTSARHRSDVNVIILLSRMWQYCLVADVWILCKATVIRLSPRKAVDGWIVERL